MHIHLGVFEPARSDRPAGVQKPFFSDEDRPRREELDQAILCGKLTDEIAEFRHESEYKLGAWLSRAGL